MNTPNGPIKVLYVDDEQGNLLAFKAGFRRDFDVRTASSAQEALALLKDWHAHVVMSDQRMPGTNGAEFLAQVRAQRPDCIRIMVTGYSDIEAVVDVISKGAAQSWQMENRHKTMAAGHYDYGFAVEWMRKDLGICLEEARRAGVSLPVAALVDQFYAEVEGLGGKRWDTSSLFARQEYVRQAAQRGKA